MAALLIAIRQLRRLNTLLLLVCRYATIVLMGAIALVVIAGVVWRYFLNDSLSWTEETAKFLMVWLVFAGSPIALRHGGHAAIDTLPNALPQRLRQFVFFLVYLIVLALMVVLVYRGGIFAWNARGQETATTQISMIYVFGAMPLGATIMLLVSLELWLQSIAGLFSPERGVHVDNVDAASTSPE